MRYKNVGDLKVAVVKHLAKRDYARTYKNEAAFEAEVWKRVVNLVSKAGMKSETVCLTSHKSIEGRSSEEWQKFCQQNGGPDVRALGSNNRLDIVVKHPRRGSIGIEVKCLGRKRHAAKLTQGLGQAMLGLAHRDYSVLIIHCGTVKIKGLRNMAKKICRGSRTSIIVAHGTRSAV